MKSTVVVFIILALVVPHFAAAIAVIEFDTPAERERYQKLSAELRCPKCQNQNLIDSDSVISEDLRLEVARLVKEGKSNREIKEHMVSLYGDFILYRPPVQSNTVILWVAPVAMLGLGLLIFAIIVYRRARLSDERDEDPEQDEDEQTSKA